MTFGHNNGYVIVNKLLQKDVTVNSYVKLTVNSYIKQAVNSYVKLAVNSYLKSDHCCFLSCEPICTLERMFCSKVKLGLGVTFGDCYALKCCFTLTWTDDKILLVLTVIKG